MVSDPTLLMLEIECSEGLEVSAAGRPDKRFEVLVRCCFEENEPRDDCFLSASTVLGLGSGDVLSGSAMRTAVWYVSLSSLARSTQRRYLGDLEENVQKKPGGFFSRRESKVIQTIRSHAPVASTSTAIMGWRMLHMHF